MKTRVDFCAEVENEMKLLLPSLSVNEGMARSAVAAFCAQLNPTAVELADLKCAVSEAVTNCIVHAYRQQHGKIYITVSLYKARTVCISVVDKGCGIENLQQALLPLYTTDAEGERSGMGFTVMENFMDSLRVTSKKGEGTRVVLIKQLGKRGREE